MASKRLHPEVRKEAILAAAAVACRLRGDIHITRAEVASQAGVAEATVSLHYGTMHQLRIALVRHAELKDDVPVLAAAWVSDKYRVGLTGDQVCAVMRYIREVRPNE